MLSQVRQVLTLKSWVIFVKPVQNAAQDAMDSCEARVYKTQIFS